MQQTTDVYIINLERHKHKKEDMLKKLETVLPVSHQWNIHFVCGIDGNACSEEVVNMASRTWRDPVFNTVIRKGEIGCALSHLFVWQQIVAGSKDYAIVFEDDIEFDEQFIDKFTYVDKFLKHKSEFDIFYLSRNKRSNEDEPELYDWPRIVKDVRCSYWTCAYAVSKRFADILCKGRLEKRIIPSDEYLSIMYDTEWREFNLQTQRIMPYDYVFPQRFVNVFALVNDIVSPSRSAFIESETHKSEIVDLTSVVNPYLTVITVATDAEHDGYKRFMMSAKVYGHHVVTLGLNEHWQGGNMKTSTGGAHKVVLFHDYIKSYLDAGNDPDRVFCFFDAYDVLITSPPFYILSMFKLKACDVLFAAEDTCWPDKSLAKHFTHPGKYKYLNSGGIIGSAKSLYALTSDHKLRNNDDDQLFYTFQMLRNQSNLSIKLDHDCSIFQCNLDSDNIMLVVRKGTSPYVHNTDTGSRPLVLHGNGPTRSKIKLNQIGNYLCTRWESSYMFSETYARPLRVVQNMHVNVLIILDDTKYINNVVSTLKQSYANDDGVINFMVICHEKLKYRIQSRNDIDGKCVIYYETNARLNKHVQRILAQSAAGGHSVFVMFGNQVIPNIKETLTTLYSRSDAYTVIAPFIKMNHSIFSNFWGEVNFNNGEFYQRSFDYVDICNGDRRGIWNVPYLMYSWFLRDAKHIKKFMDATNNNSSLYTIDIDYDMFVCKCLRENSVFMFVDNLEKYNAYILDGDTLEDVPAPNPKSVTHVATSTLFDLDYNFLYTTRKNFFMKTVLHESMYKFLVEGDRSPYLVNSMFSEPVLDVFMFPLFKPEFCERLIERAESVNAWSGGEKVKGKYDQRIGNTEPYPTVDIHMKDLGMENMWSNFVKDYIAEIASYLFDNMVTKEVNIAFIAKYDMSGQTKLEPHHDASTYTINIALNPSSEYTGGGVRFLNKHRKKSITNIPVGHCLLHPGRVTHKHEGLPITSGKRYIAVSFVF